MAPLLRAETLERLVEAAKAAEAAGVLLTAMMDDPTGYGRVIRGPAGGSTAIVEQKAATPGATGHPRSQHGDLLLPRGPVLEARGRDPRPTIRPASITSPTWWRS